MKKSGNAFRRKAAGDGVLAWMDSAIATHESYVRDFKRRRTELALALSGKSESFVSDLVDILGYFINDLNNLQRNLRLDMVPSHAAALALTKKED